ncbi:GMC family oxidoreductase N-terminal domain-containing protein [Mesorhizobium sp. YR577]|uniref:GMC family oxidoreductase n=1 Tax=Mesorhizobium sp. YR577 TaxID=1884373 RepID=UPI0008EF64CA|nr:GMC family oxidoreductase N-terminal domain-containing protein [Mesorhizobium sp. YR577]SFU21955.1 choline oxidase [Mesorhizobium sp. YR577]
MNIYDIVVVGAGAAGAALAARLSEYPDINVLLIEAGQENPYDIGRSQGAFFLTWGTDKNWAYETISQPFLNGRIIQHPRGRAVGGSTTLNVGAWLRGRPEDYDAWEAAGAKGWNGKTAVDAFLQIEASDRGPSDTRGHDGIVVMNDLTTPTDLSEKILDAYVNAGLGKRGDSNGSDPFVAERFQTLFVDGVRRTIADDFLDESVRARANLTILTGAHVTRVVFEGNKAVGVEIRDVDGVRTIGARREVVLSAGAFNTPQILMLSGVGPREHIEELGLDVIVDLPGVGQNLQDHLYAHVYTLGTADAKGSVAPDLGDAAVQRWLETHNGPASYFPENGVAWASLDGHAVPDFEFLLSYNTTSSSFPQFPDADKRSGVTIGVVLLQPRSRGSVRLASADPFAKPLIDPSYLSEQADVETLVSGLRIAHRMVASSVLASWAETIYPSPDASDEELAAHIRADVGTVFHPVGTARMGSADDANAVVDSELRVRGVEGLRVADASVMPTVIRGHTMAPSVFIGYRAAEIIRRDKAAS